MSDPIPSAPHFRDSNSMEDLGPAPCRVQIPPTAWLYGGDSNPIDFAAFEDGAWLYLLLRIEGEATVGVSVMKPDGSALLIPERVLEPGPALQSILLLIPANIGVGSLLLRNYGADRKSSRVDILNAEFLPSASARLAEAITPIFDVEWYQALYPGTNWSNVDPLIHYVNIGAAAGADPNPFFNGQWYAAHLSGPASEMSAIEHYLSVGIARDYDPSPIFAVRWYRQQCDLQDGGMSPLAHYMQIGRSQGRPPNPYDSACLLQDLVDEGDIENAGRWFAHLEASTDGPRATAMILALEEVYGHARDNGEIIYGQLDADPSHERAAGGSPPRYIAAFDRVAILGGNGLIATAAGSGKALHDELFYSQEHFPTESKSGHIAMLPDKRLMLRAPDNFTQHIADGIHLMAEADANYFHWVVEILPRLLLLQESGILENLPLSMPLLVTEGLDPRLVELAGYLAPGDRPIRQLKRDQLYKVDRVIYPGALARILNNYYAPPSTISTYLPVDVLARMVSTIKQRVVQVDTARRRRIYLHRGGATRVLLGQSELQEALIERGYEIVDPSALSAKAQIQLFSQCDHVIAPTGAAVTNILWCNPGTRITVLYADHKVMNTGIWSAMAQAAGCNVDHIMCPRTYDIVGKYSVHDNYSFPLEWLPRLL